MRRLSALGRHRLLLVAIGAGQLVATAAIALLIGALIANLGAGAGVSSAELALLAAAAAAATALRYAERVQGEASAQQVVHDKRIRLARHLLRLPPSEAARAESGFLLRFTGDLSAVRTWHARGVPGLLIGVPAVCGCLAALLILDWRIGLVGAGLFAVALGLQVLIAPRLRGSARMVRRRRSRVFQAAAEASQSLASIQLLGRSAAHLRRIERRSGALAAALTTRARWGGLVRATGDLAATGLPVAMIALWQLTGAGEAGAIGAALAVSALVSPRVRELARIREYRELANLSEERIASFLERPPLKLRSSAPRLRSGRGRLELCGLCLPGIFENVTVDAPPRTRIAITGPNGAGKSRLLGVIAGLEAPAAGHVAMDGERVDGRRLASLRQAVALAGPAMPLVDGSVSRNIRYGMRASDAACATISRPLRL